MYGVINDTHIEISNKPKRAYTPIDYWCQHDAYMVLLQGICDHDY